MAAFEKMYRYKVLRSELRFGNDKQFLSLSDSLFLLFFFQEFRHINFV